MFVRETYCRDSLAAFMIFRTAANRIPDQKSPMYHKRPLL
jgi:hypothetical protein